MCEVQICSHFTSEICEAEIDMTTSETLPDPEVENSDIVTESLMDDSTEPDSEGNSKHLELPENLEIMDLPASPGGRHMSVSLDQVESDSRGLII